MFGPQPRQRLYTTAAAYAGLWGNIATGRARAGDGIASLEEALRAHVGASHALTAPLARTAIYLVLRALIQPGQNVVMSPYTISDVVNMVLCAGGRPVFADTESGTCNIDPHEVEQLIDANTGAVLATHFHGLACDIERIQSICAARGVPLVEDCAQALGTWVGGKHVGTFGDAGVFSFGLFKCVTSFLGGAVVTDNPQIARTVGSQLDALDFERPSTLLARSANAAVIDLATNPLVFRAITFPAFRWARTHGVEALERQFAFDHVPTAKNAIPGRYLRRMTPAQARIAASQLPRVDAQAAQRIRAAQVYQEGLAEVREVRVPPHRGDRSHTYQYYPVHVPDREALVTFALRHGRDIAVSHHRNCASMECFREFARHCPNAATSERDVVYLPTYPGYTDAEIRKNVAIVRRFFGYPV